MTPMTEIEKLKDGVYEKVMSRRFAEVLKEALAEDQVRAEEHSRMNSLPPLQRRQKSWEAVRRWRMHHFC